MRFSMGYSHRKSELAKRWVGEAMSANPWSERLGRQSLGQQRLGRQFSGRIIFGRIIFGWRSQVRGILGRRTLGRQR